MYRCYKDYSTEFFGIYGVPFSLAHNIHTYTAYRPIYFKIILDIGKWDQSHYHTYRRSGNEEKCFICLV